MIQIIGYILGMWLVYAAISALSKHKTGLIIISCLSVIAGISNFIANGSYESLISSIIGILCIAFIKPIQIKNDRKTLNKVDELNDDDDNNNDIKKDNENDRQIINNDQINIAEQTIFLKEDDFDISIEQVNRMRKFMDDHKSSNISKYVKKYKQTNDKKYLKDICEIIIFMYHRNENIFITKDNNIIDGVILDWKSYIAVYTDENFIPSDAKHKVQTIPLRDFFVCFNEFYNKNLCNGIIINSMSKEEFILTKEAIDGLRLDLF